MFPRVRDHSSLISHYCCLVLSHKVFFSFCWRLIWPFYLLYLTDCFFFSLYVCFCRGKSCFYQHKPVWHKPDKTKVEILLWPKVEWASGFWKASSFLVLIIPLPVFNFIWVFIALSTLNCSTLVLSFPCTLWVFLLFFHLYSNLFCFHLSGIWMFTLTWLACFSCEVLMISCYPCSKQNWNNHLYLDPLLLLAFVAHCEMWCFWKLAIGWLTSEPFHQTSGGVVKPFEDAEPWTEGSVQQQ